MNDNVVNFPGSASKDYPQLADLTGRIFKNIITECHGQPLIVTLGILDLIRFHLLQGADG